MVPPTRRATLKALPALAAGLAGCGGLAGGEDDALPTPTRWRVRADDPAPVARPADGPLLVAARSPFADEPVLSGRDPETGEELWSITGEKGRKSPIGVDERLAYVFTKAGELFAVDYGRGEVEWTTSIRPVDEADPGVVQFAPLRVGDRVVVPVSGTEDDVPDRLEGYDRDAGEHRFDREFESSISGAPAADGTAAIVPLLDGTVRRIGADGTEEWRVDVGVPLSDVTVADGTAYAGSPAEELLAFDAATGDPRWRGPLENTLLTRPLVAADRVFVGGADYYLSAFDRASGRRLWRAETPNAVTSGPTRIEDRLVCLSGGATRHRGPSGTVPFSPTALSVHDPEGKRVGEYRFEGYLEGGSVTWAAATTDGVYLGQEWQLARLDREVLDAE